MRIFSKITDDMYMELEKEQTNALLEELLFNALPWFEFPRVNLQDYNLDGKYFNVNLKFTLKRAPSRVLFVFIIYQNLS